MARRDWTRPEEQRAAEWRRGGLKVAVIARRLGRTHRSVVSKLRQLRVVVAPWCRRRRRPGKLARAVREMCGAGLSDAESATRLGVDPSLVCRTRQRLGIPGPSPSERTRRGWELRKCGEKA
jgi:DNA-binding CsgD family transcriptional regulator